MKRPYIYIWGGFETVSRCDKHPYQMRKRDFYCGVCRGRGLFFIIQLDSARNWGIVDLLGGGFFTDLIKHSKMGKAEKYLSQARYYLQQFQKELRNVAADDTIQLQTGDFLSFADFFFDGVVADYLVQSRINETRRKVAEAIRRVEELTAKLRAKYSYFN